MSELATANKEIFVKTGNVKMISTAGGNYIIHYTTDCDYTLLYV